jgi:hypothetical protein
MRHNLPQDIPNERTIHAPRAAPLEPSPLEKHRDHLSAQREIRRTPNVPLDKRNRSARLERTREIRSRDHTPDRRPSRKSIPQQIVGLSLREEERKMLSEVGRFRVVTTRDIAETIYGNRHPRMERDLAFLRAKGFVQIDSVNARRDGRGGKVESIEVVTLTKAGRDAARQITGLPQDQQLYSGLVKPREVEHDTQIYRAYRKEAERIEQRGGTNLRVKLDFELKSDIQKAIHAERKADPERDMTEIKQQVARDFELPYVNDGIQIPDARIVYDRETDQGSRSGHEDIEVLTAAYSPGHLRAKAQAGFRVYASSADRASMTAKIEGNHYLMENILEL